MKAYSLDLRERVLRAVDQGEPRSEIVRMLGVSLSTIKRYLKQRRESGHVRPKAIPGRPARKGAALEGGLVAQLQAHPDVSEDAALRAVGKRAGHAGQHLDHESAD